MNSGVTELHVRIVSARNLLDTQTFGTQDPFVNATIGKRTFKTKVHDNGGKNPIWNEKFVFEVYDLQSEQLVLIVKNKNFADDALIGECRLQVSMFKSGEVFDQWFTLNKGNKKSGDINLRIQLCGTGYPNVSNAVAQKMPEAQAMPAAAVAVGGYPGQVYAAQQAANMQAQQLAQQQMMVQQQMMAQQQAMIQQQQQAQMAAQRQPQYMATQQPVYMQQPMMQAHPQVVMQPGHPQVVYPGQPQQVVYAQAQPGVMYAQPGMVYAQPSMVYQQPPYQ